MDLPEMPDEDIINLAIEQAKQGEVNAQRMLGYMYETHFEHEKAFYWFNKASEQGDAEATGALGHLYFNGRGVPEDWEKAINFLKYFK